MADREGFEPSIGFILYTISNRAPSASRTPIQKLFFTFIFYSSFMLLSNGFLYSLPSIPL